MIRIVLLLVGAYAALCVLVFFMRDRLVYPVRGGAGDPVRLGIRDGVVVAIPTGDGDSLGGWFLPAVPATGGRSGVLVWFHGNAETVAGLAPVLREFRPPGVAVLAVDYRGYGTSTGHATVDAGARDAIAVWKWLEARSDIYIARVVVYGRSIGSGPAIHLAASRPVAGLIVESGFTTLRDLAHTHYPFIPSFLAGSAFDNLAGIAAVRGPVLLIHGDRDRVVPTAMGRALAERLGTRGELWIIPGADHNETYDLGGEEYVRRVREFVERATALPTRGG